MATEITCTSHKQQNYKLYNYPLKKKIKGESTKETIQTHRHPCAYVHWHPYS